MGLGDFRWSALYLALVTALDVSALILHVCVVSAASEKRMCKKEQRVTEQRLNAMGTVRVWTPVHSAQW